MKKTFPGIGCTPYILRKKIQICEPLLGLPRTWHFLMKWHLRISVSLVPQMLWQLSIKGMKKTFLEQPNDCFYACQVILLGSSGDNVVFFWRHSSNGRPHGDICKYLMVIEVVAVIIVDNSLAPFQPGIPMSRPPTPLLTWTNWPQTSPDPCDPRPGSSTKDGLTYHLFRHHRCSWMRLALLP